MKFGPWILFSELQKGGVRRWVIRREMTDSEGTRRYPRLPVSEYRRIRDDEPALRELVVRLNHSQDVKAKAAIAWQHAFISPELLNDYQEYLGVKIPSPKGARQEFSYLKRHVLDYFIHKLGLTYIAEWQQAETRWARYLLDHKKIRSAKAKRDVVIAANRFAQWLHKKRPEDTPLVEFSPLSKAHYSKIEAERELAGEVHETRYMADADWKRIEKDLPPALRPYVLLAYHYGLRRGESMAFKLDDVRNDYLSVERQLEKIKHPAPLKGRLKRKVPHWFATPKKAYAWITEILAARPLHPRTLSELWQEYVASLGLSYTLHDLRHTFITRALRKAPHPRDVQQAAGHKNILTTMAYARDDRNLGDTPFNPAA